MPVENRSELAYGATTGTLTELYLIHYFVSRRGRAEGVVQQPDSENGHAVLDSKLDSNADT